MNIKKRQILLLASIVLCAALLCGCAAKIEFQNGSFPKDSTDIAIKLAPGESAALDGFTALKSADLSGSEDLQEIMLWAENHPQVNVKYCVEFPDGQVLDNSAELLDLSSVDEAQLPEIIELMAYLPSLKELKLGENASYAVVTQLSSAFPQLKYDFSFELLGKTCTQETEALDLSGIKHEDVAELLPWLPVMSGLKNIELGAEDTETPLPWDDIAAIQAAAPNAVLNYSFTAFGMPLTLNEEVLNLRHIAMDDEGALVKQITGCMKNLKYLDMDSCGVSNESMAEIRDSLPNTDVVWRVVFGRYSVRTDVERIMASNPGMGGDLYETNTEGLKYCTKVKYLDLGHNRTLDSISFVSYMPDLEVAILAMNNWSDPRPLADCPKLEYLELFETGLNDLRPLAELKNLKHLNVAQCYALHDISPLYGMESLERLWLGAHTPVPMDQIQKMQESVPGCDVNYTSESPLGGTWRFAGKDGAGFTILNPRYVQLCEQMGYGAGDASYDYYFNDPLYFGPNPMPIPPI